MTIALLVESGAPALDGLPATNQTLLFGYQGEVQTYHRTSNGTKGRGQVWSKVDTTDSLPDNPTLTEPVAVVLNERDLQMVELGLVTNIAVKALYANESATPATAPTSHKEQVNNLIGRLVYGDPTLADYITDKRRTGGVDIRPLTKVTGVMPNIADSVAPTTTAPKYEEVEAKVMDNNSMAMAMITVPDPKWAKEYINRKVSGVLDWDIFDRALDTKTNVLIEGGAGSGKTIAVQAYASARRMRYFNVSNNNGIEPSQLFGRWIPREDGLGYRWQDGAVTEIVRNGGVLLLNEVNFLPARVSTVLFSLLDYRREIQLLDKNGEVVRAHPNLLVIADMNAGYKGTQELNQAFSDRFGIKLEFPYDRSIENKIIGNKSLLTLADKLRDQYDKNEISSPISTRSLVAFKDNAIAFGIDFAITSFVNGFNKEERGGVRLSIETFKENIADEMKLKVMTHPDMDSYVTETI